MSLCCVSSPDAAAVANEAADALRALPTANRGGAPAMTALLRSVSASGREGLLDLKLLGFLADRWRSAGRGPEVAFYLDEAARAVYGRRPHGEERRLLGEGLDRLAAARVSLSYLSASEHPGRHRRVRRNAALVADLTVSAEHPRRGQRTARGGAVHRVTLGAWLVEALERGELEALTLPALVALSGLPLRLFLVLESIPAIASGAREQLPAIAIDAELRETLGLRFARPTDERKALRRAGARLVADSRYLTIDLSPREHIGRWQIAAERRAAGAAQLTLGRLEESA